MELGTSKNRLTEITQRSNLREDADAAHVQYLVHTLRIFETEFLVQLKEWHKVLAVIEVFGSHSSWQSWSL